MNDWQKWIVVSLLVVALGGCAVVPMAPYDDRPVRVAPPPPRVEYPGRAPYDGYVWLNGYWYWGGRDYVWMGGSWAAPRPGYRWTPHRWEHQGDRWEMRGGRWESEGRGRYESPRVVPHRAPPPVYTPPRQLPSPRVEDNRRHEREPRGQSPYGQERHMERERQMLPGDIGGRGVMPRAEVRPPPVAPMPMPARVLAPPTELRRQDRSDLPGGRPQRGRHDDRLQDESSSHSGRQRHF